MIRSAVKSDLVAIQLLNQQIFEVEIKSSNPDGWNKNYPFEISGLEYLEGSIACENGFSCYVYEQNKNVVAYIVLFIVPEKDVAHRSGVRVVQVHTLCVDENCRGQGIGSKMLEFASDWAEKQSATHLKVVYMSGNEHACKVYKSFGFQEFEITYEMKL